MVSSKDRLLALWVRLRSILSGRDWIYLSSLLVPLMFYNLTLKAIRIHSQQEMSEGFSAVGLMRSDLLFNLGYALLWIGLFALAKRRYARKLVVVFFHVLAVLVAATTTGAHLYFRETGSTLDLNMIVYSLSKWGEIEDVVASVASPASLALIVGVLYYAVMGPLLITWLLCGRRDPSAAGGSTGVYRPAPLVVCLTAISFVALSLPTDSGEASKSFSRDPVVNVIASEFEHARLRSSIEKIDASETKLPVNTSLEQTAQTQRRNVVLIHLESVRARSVTPYNEELKTTPFLEELSKESLLAQRAYAVVPHTSKAVTSVNCGIEPHLVREITEIEPNSIPARCLAFLLKEQGYDTVLFQSATEEFEDRRRLVENFGYEEFYPLETMNKEGFQEANYFGYEDEIMLKPSREWLEEHRDGPFLAMYLGVTGHHDYRPVTRYGTREYAEKEGLNRYQNTVRYLDFYVRNLIEQYKELGLYENTIFVIYSDHGEGFGEHDLYQHDNTIYEEGVRIPLVVHEPGRFQNGERVETLANEMDILPTVLDLLGYEVEGGEYPGRSLLAPPARDRTLYFSCFDDYRCLASLKGTEKYIYFFGNKPEELYDLSSDPLEKNNIADERGSKEIKVRRSEVLAWYSRVNAMYEGREEMSGER
jgi:arylsulfatase A-like enzyme